MAHDINQPQEPEKTLAELFYYLPDPEARGALERYRIAFEEFNPPVDMQRRYTCMWPKEQQEWMKQNEPRRYWDGFPRFVKAWLKRQVEEAIKSQQTAGIESYLLELYGRNQMDIGEDGHRPEKRGR